MPSRKRPAKGLRLPCAQLHEDDGIDPKEFSRKTSHSGDERKTRQLCRQVYRTLCCLFPAGIRDTVLQQFIVKSVTPAPDASRLLVTLEAAGTQAPSTDRAMAALAHVQGWIRTEVAGDICRRRAPELVYRICDRGEVDA